MAPARAGVAGARSPAPAIRVRPARRGDLDEVFAIDARVTGVPKRDYWLALYRR